jgi:hypothetical protein
MRRIARRAVLGTLVLAGCGSVVPPTMPTFATRVETTAQGRNVAFTVTPWPLDSTVAFLCVDKPGAEFTFDHPVPAASARCVPLDAKTNDDRLVATFNRAALTPDQVGQFRLMAPAYLAVAGKRAPFSGSTILTVVVVTPSAAPG